MTNKVALLLALTAVVLPWSLTSAGCAEEDRETRIIWEDDEHTQALFIPEKVLNSTPIESLPLSESDRYDLRWELAFWRDKPEGIWSPGGKVPDCNPAPRPPDLSTTLPDLVDVVSHEKEAFLGTVIDSVTGFRPKIKAFVGQMLYVVVTQVLRDMDQGLEIGGIYTVPLYHGSMVVQGTVLCQAAQPDGDFPAVGDRVLVIGSLNPPDPILVIDGTAFVVTDQTIPKARYGRRSFNGGMEIGALVKALAGEKKP